MTAFQLGFETRLIVRVVRSDPSCDNVINTLKQSSKEELAQNCPATDASLLFYAVQRRNDEEAQRICRYLCEDVKVCEASKADRNSQTALFFAARDGNVGCVKYLISRGCNPDHRDSALQTALFYAARDGRNECVNALLDAGADVNAADHLGQTALFYASRDGRIDTVSLMLGKGANISVKDRQRRTALFYANRNNHRELVTLLKAAGMTSGSVTPTRQQSTTEIEPPTDSSNVESSRPSKRPCLGSPEISPFTPPSLTTAIAPTSPSGQTAPPTEQTPLLPLRRRCFRLVIKGPPNINNQEIQWLSAPEEQIAIFETLAPSIAVWPKATPSPVTDILFDLRSKWQSIALSIIGELSTIEGGWIFAKPVDCKAWGCPDYYDVIERPMDYSTIKKKFKSQAYQRCSDFLTDMNLIFTNCCRYNKPDSPVSQLGRTIEKLFHELFESKGLQKWIDDEKKIEEWYITRKNQMTPITTILHESQQQTYEVKENNNDTMAIEQTNPGQTKSIVGINTIMSDGIKNVSGIDQTLSEDAASQSQSNGIENGGIKIEE